MVVCAYVLCGNAIWELLLFYLIFRIFIWFITAQTLQTIIYITKQTYDNLAHTTFRHFPPTALLPSFHVFWVIIIRYSTSFSFMPNS